jgi:hypothetical protein
VKNKKHSRGRLCHTKLANRKRKNNSQPFGQIAICHLPIAQSGKRPVLITPNAALTAVHLIRGQANHGCS